MNMFDTKSPYASGAKRYTHADVVEWAKGSVGRMRNVKGNLDSIRAQGNNEVNHKLVAKNAKDLQRRLKKALELRGDKEADNFIQCTQYVYNNQMGLYLAYVTESGTEFEVSVPEEICTNPYAAEVWGLQEITSNLQRKTAVVLYSRNETMVKCFNGVWKPKKCQDLWAKVATNALAHPVYVEMSSVTKHDARSVA